MAIPIRYESEFMEFAEFDSQLLQLRIFIRGPLIEPNSELLIENLH